MSDIKKTARYSAIYAVGILLNRVVSFIMLPIYTRYLTTSDYGTLELMTMTIDIFGMIAGAGLLSAINRYYYKYTDPAERETVISTIALLLLAFYLVGSLIGLSLSGIFSQAILSGLSDGEYYFKIMFVCFFIQAFVEIPLVYIKTQQRPFLFVSISVIKLVLQLSLNIYFIIFLEMGILGILYGTLISFSTVGVFLIGYTFYSTGFHFSKKKAAMVISFGAPFIVSNAGDFILTFSDRFFLQYYTDLATVGIYALGYKLGFLLWVFPVKPIMDVWKPQRFEIAQKGGSDQIHGRVFFFFNLVLIFCALGISLFCYDLFRIMSAPEFWDAYQVVPLIMIAYTIQGWTTFGNFGILYHEKTHYIAKASFAAVIVALILNVVLISAFGVYGAAVATIIAFLVRFFIVYYFSQRLYPLSLPWIKVSIMAGTASGIYMVAHFFRQESITLSLIVNSVLALTYLFILFLLPVFNSNEKQMILRLIKNPIKSLKSGGSS